MEKGKYAKNKPSGRCRGSEAALEPNHHRFVAVFSLLSFVHLALSGSYFLSCLLTLSIGVRWCYL
jgi:hypothetical protein